MRGHTEIIKFDNSRHSTEILEIIGKGENIKGLNGYVMIYPDEKVHSFILYEIDVSEERILYMESIEKNETIRRRSLAMLLSMILGSERTDISYKANDRDKEYVFKSENGIILENYFGFERKGSLYSMKSKKRSEYENIPKMKTGSFGSREMNKEMRNIEMIINGIQIDIYYLELEDTIPEELKSKGIEEEIKEYNRKLENVKKVYEQKKSHYYDRKYSDFLVNQKFFRGRDTKKTFVLIPEDYFKSETDYNFILNLTLLSQNPKTTLVKYLSEKFPLYDLGSNIYRVEVNSGNYEKFTAVMDRLGLGFIPVTEKSDMKLINPINMKFDQTSGFSAYWNYDLNVNDYNNIDGNKIKFLDEEEMEIILSPFVIKKKDREWNFSAMELFEDMNISSDEQLREFLNTLNEAVFGENIKNEDLRYIMYELHTTLSFKTFFDYLVDSYNGSSKFNAYFKEKIKFYMKYFIEKKIDLNKIENMISCFDINEKMTIKAFEALKNREYNIVMSEFKNNDFFSGFSLNDKEALPQLLYLYIIRNLACDVTELKKEIVVWCNNMKSNSLSDFEKKINLIISGKGYENEVPQYLKNINSLDFSLTEKYKEAGTKYYSKFEQFGDGKEIKNIYNFFKRLEKTISLNKFI